MRKEELQRFPGRYIKCYKFPDGREVRSNREMREIFRTHFRDRFTRCPDPQVQEFRKFLAVFPRLGEVEGASYEGASP